MPLSAEVTGTVTAADLVSMTIRRDPDGDLVGAVSVSIDLEGIVQQRTFEWALSTAQRNALVSDFLSSALQAARDGLGL